jgi:sugar/nucleoside kinase (ribokinase family)
MPTTRNNWRNTTRRTNAGFGGTRRTNTTNSFSYGNSTNWNPTAYSPNRFSTCRETITCKIESFRTINEQFRGNGKVTAFSPTTAGRWINYVNDGCNIYKFSNNDFCRSFRFASYASPTRAFRQLRNKFGNGIKAVTRGKGGCWLIAATPRVTARPFSTYNW